MNFTFEVARMRADVPIVWVEPGETGVGWGWDGGWRGIKGELTLALC